MKLAHSILQHEDKKAFRWIYVVILIAGQNLMLKCFSYFYASQSEYNAAEPKPLRYKILGVSPGTFFENEECSYARSVQRRSQQVFEILY